MEKMKNKENIWAIALFGMLVVVMSFGIQIASAGPLGGGDSFDNATQIYSGHTAEAWLNESNEEYFYITVNPGQMLVVKVASVYDKGGMQITISLVKIFYPDIMIKVGWPPVQSN